MVTDYELYSKEPEAMNAEKLVDVVDVFRERLQRQTQKLLTQCAKEASESVRLVNTLSGEDSLHKNSCDFTVGELNRLVKILRETEHLLALRFQYTPYGKKE